MTPDGLLLLAAYGTACYVLGLITGARLIVARYLQLTDEDLAVLGPVALIVAGVVIRAGVFSPATVSGSLDHEDEPGS